MATVNIDAELVRRGGALEQEEKMVELSNGCICCTLREDLLTSLTSLASENRFDHVIVESSGISEPLPVAESRQRAAEHRTTDPLLPPLPDPPATAILVISANSLT